MITREITGIINNLRNKFSIISLTGSRQIGKTTLLKSVYTDISYISFEDSLSKVVLVIVEFANYMARDAILRQYGELRWLIL